MTSFRTFKIYFHPLEESNFKSILWKDDLFIGEEIHKICAVRDWNMDYFQIRDEAGTQVDIDLTLKEYGKDAVYMVNVKEHLVAKRKNLLKKTETLKQELVKESSSRVLESSSQTTENTEEGKEKESKKPERRSRKEKEGAKADDHNREKDIVDFAIAVHSIIFRLLEIQSPPNTPIPLSHIFTTKKPAKPLTVDLNLQQLEEINAEDLGAWLIHYFFSLEQPLVHQIYNLLLETLDIENHEWRLSIWSHILFQVPSVSRSLLQCLVETFNKLFLVSKFDFTEIDYASVLWANLIFVRNSPLKDQIMKPSAKAVKSGQATAPTPRTPSTPSDARQKYASMSTSSPVIYGTPRASPQTRKKTTNTSMRSFTSFCSSSSGTSTPPTTPLNNNNSNTASPVQLQANKKASSEPEPRKRSQSASEGVPESSGSLPDLSASDKQRSKTIRVKELRRSSANRHEKFQSSVHSGQMPTFHVLDESSSEHKEQVKAAMKKSKSSDAVSSKFIKECGSSTTSADSGDASKDEDKERSVDVEKIDIPEGTSLSLMFSAISSTLTLSPRSKKTDTISPRPNSPRRGSIPDFLQRNRISPRPGSPRGAENSSAPQAVADNVASVTSSSGEFKKSRSSDSVPEADAPDPANGQIKADDSSSGYISSKILKSNTPSSSPKTAKRQVLPLNLKKMIDSIPPCSPLVMDTGVELVLGQVFQALCQDSELLFIISGPDRVYEKNSHGHYTLQASTLDYLVWVLFQVDYYYIDAHFENALLTLFSYFTTSTELLEKIVLQYVAISNQDLYGDGHWKIWLRQRILQIIIKLLEIQNRDLLDDAKFCGLLSTFVEDISGECWRPSEKKLLSELEKIRSTTTTSEVSALKLLFTKRTQEIPNTITTELIAGDRACLSNIVEQLALLHYSVFSLTWRDLINQNFMVAEKAVGILTAHYNEIVKWVQTVILSVPDLVQRSQVFSSFVEIAEKSIEHSRNFMGALAIFTGLESSAINRLKQTRSGLSRKSQKQLEKLEQTFSYEKSYKEYRKVFHSKKHSSTEPTIPALVIFTKDLFAIEDGSKNVVSKDSVTLINVHKLRMLYKTMDDVLTKPAKPYPFASLENYQLYFTNLNFKDTEELWHLSKQVEPS